MKAAKFIPGYFLGAVLLLSFISQNLSAQDKPAAPAYGQDECPYTDLSMDPLDSIRCTYFIDACICLLSNEFQNAKENLEKALKTGKKVPADSMISKYIFTLDTILAAAAANDSAKIASDSIVPSGTRVKSFSTAEMNIFHDRGIQKMRLFETFLNKIGNKNTAAPESNKATVNALKLFDKPENRFVAVSSLTRASAKYPLAVYLKRVRALSFDKIEVEFADFLYVSKLRLAPDGNYYGFIKFRQRFKGIKDGIVVYEDVTDKVVAVILKPYLKAEEGAYKEEYEVFLGDIEVQQTSKP